MLVASIDYGLRSSTLRPRPAGRLESLKRERAKVDSGSLIYVDNNADSVHSRLLGARVEARLVTEKIKGFVGTSENALRIRIWSVLIAILLLDLPHHRFPAPNLNNLCSGLLDLDGPLTENSKNLISRRSHSPALTLLFSASASLAPRCRGQQCSFFRSFTAIW